MKIDTKILLTIISLVAIFMRESEIPIILWVCYGIYRYYK